MPQFLNDADAQARIARAPQPGPGAFGAAPASALGQPAASFSPPFSSPYGAPAGGAVSPAGPSDDGAMPDWLRAQAGAAPAGAGTRDGGFAASDLIDPAALPAWVTGKGSVEQVFSSTLGWSAANPDSPSAFATSDQGMEQGASQRYAEQGFEQGFGQSFDQSQQGAAGYADFGGDESAQPAWGDAQWDADGSAGSAGSAHGDDDASHGRRSQRRAQRDGRHAQAQPLAPDELPPWLLGKAGAPAAQRNPWASAAAPMEPMEPMEAWEEEEPWSAQQGAPAEQGWDADASQWGSSGAQQVDQRGAQQGGWDYAEPPAEWGEQPSGRRHHGRSAERRRDGWDDDPAYSSSAHAGYTDERYARRYDQSPDGYGEYDEDDDEYADDPSDRKRGRGWLGFMRRDKR
jgi:hypothetical protein